MGARWGCGVHTWPGGSSVAGQLCGEGEGAATTDSQVWTKYTCSPHTCCQPAAGPYGKRRESAAGGCEGGAAPTRQSCLAPTAMGTEVPGEEWGGEGAGFCSGRWGRHWGFFLISCTGSRYARDLASALTATGAGEHR